LEVGLFQQLFFLTEDIMLLTSLLLWTLVSSKSCGPKEFNMWGTGMCNVNTDCSQSHLRETFCRKTCCSKAEMAVADDCYWTGDCEEAVADDCFWTGDCEKAVAGLTAEAYCDKTGGIWEDRRGCNYGRAEAEASVGWGCPPGYFQTSDGNCLHSETEKAIADDCYWTGDCETEKAVADDCYWTGDCEEGVGGFGGECKQKDLDAGCQTVMKPFGPMKVPTCQCSGDEEAVAQYSYSQQEMACYRNGGQWQGSWCDYSSHEAEETQKSLAMSRTSHSVGPSKIVQAMALVGFVVTVYGAACHFLKN